MTSLPKRKLVISVTEVVDVPLIEDEEIDLKYVGQIPPMETELQLTYDRRMVDGKKCAPPLDPVWLDSMTEGLAYMISTATHAPDQVPLLLQLVCVRLASRVQTYAQAKFPGYMAAVAGELYRVMTQPPQVDDKRLAYLHCFNLKLRGESEPCLDCDRNATCKFKGAFEAPKEK